jgi:hypothetical protein
MLGRVVGWLSTRLWMVRRLAFGWSGGMNRNVLAQGMILRVGRYISPIDIEAHLSPGNYLYTHSVMYSVDPYTFTGVQGIFKLTDRWFAMTAIQAGNDMAPWTTSSQPNGEFLLKWVSPNNKT